MTKDEALKLALEALKRATNYDPVIARAITAIKEALAQPEQEPVGDFYITKDMAEHIKKLEVDWTICASGSKRPTEKKVVPVFVGNTTSLQRTWVGLTDEDELDWEDGGNLRDLVKAIEAALKAKNT